MFYAGDVQSGIALAVAQGKAVVCFVDHDAIAASKEWHDVLVDDDDVRELLSSQAVLLRLKAGSQDAGFLSSFCPISSIPAIIVIRNGTVQTNLQAGAVGDKETLKTRLTAAFSSFASAPTTENGAVASGNRREPTTTTAAPDTSSARDAAVAEWGFTDTVTTSQNPAAITRPVAEPASASATGRGNSNLSTARSATGGAQAASPPPTSAGSAPAAAPPPTSTATPPAQAAVARPASTPTQPAPAAPSASAAQQSQRAEYVKMQKERERQQREERARIKRQIESDRQERRRLDEIRKQGERTASPASGRQTPTGADGRPSSPAPGAVPTRPATVRVQIRALDGTTTLRQTFANTATISKDVRPWIDSSSSSSSSGRAPPYNVKLILTPQANRTIEPAEEELSLSDLGIQASCTFVMVPVKGYVESYAGGGGAGVTSGGLVPSSPFGVIGSVVTGGYNLVAQAGAMLNRLRWMAAHPQTVRDDAAAAEDEDGDAATSATAPRPTTKLSAADDDEDEGEEDDDEPRQPPQASHPKVRIRTLADQRADEAGRRRRRPQQAPEQFYNGNQLDFEPRPARRGGAGDDED